MSLIIIIIWAVLFGAVVGSFLNVCIYRIPEDMSIVYPGSSCLKCGKKISWYDNVPLLSYLILGGKCRNCKVKISIVYFIVELISGLLSGGLFYSFFLNGTGSFETAIVYILLSYALIVITFIDFKHQIIPLNITFGGIIIILLISVIIPETYCAKVLRDIFVLRPVSRLYSLKMCLLGISVSGGLIFVTEIFGRYIFKKEVMGRGDTYLMCMVGGVIGWKLGVVVYFTAPFFGLLMAIPVVIRKKAHSVPIPYGPFLSIAVILALFLRNYFLRIIDTYIIYFKLLLL